MAVKKIDIPGIGQVTLIKSATSKSIRLSVTATGVRVSMPAWTPYSAGMSFVISHASWIKTEQAKQVQGLLESGQRVGKLHYLRFEQVLGGQPLTARVSGTEVVVRMANGEESSDSTVQARARNAIIRALKREGELLLPPRLDTLAQKHSLSYASVSVKSLKRRWGSCSNNKDITFNLYLMDLSWEYIDYVIKHELAHTVEMNHGPEFWKLLISMEPRAKDIGRELRKRQPIVNS